MIRDGSLSLCCCEKATKSVLSQTDVDVCLRCPGQDLWLITSSASSLALFSLPLAFKPRLISPPQWLWKQHPLLLYSLWSNPFLNPSLSFSDLMGVFILHEWLAAIKWTLSPECHYLSAERTEGFGLHTVSIPIAALVDFNQTRTHTDMHTVYWCFHEIFDSFGLCNIRNAHNRTVVREAWPDVIAIAVLTAFCDYQEGNMDRKDQRRMSPSEREWKSVRLL